MDVDQNAGVRGRVSPREVDSSRTGTAAATDRELVACHVELSATASAGRVQGEGFGTEEIVSSWGVGGDRHIDAATTFVHVLASPEVVIARVAGRVLGPRVLEHLVPAA